MEDHIHSIPFDPLSKEIIVLIPVFIEPLVGYTYIDTSFIHPHYYYKQIKNPVAELEALHPTDFNINYRFNRKGSDIIPSLKNMHTIVAEPSFSEILPLFTYQFLINAIQNSLAIHLKQFESPLVQDSEYYPSSE